MVEDAESQTSEPQSQPPSKREGEELTVEDLRHRVPAEIRNASFPISVRGYDRRTVDAYVTRVNRVIAELEVSRSPQAAVRHALDRVGEQTIAILNEARESAEKIAAAAREEADAHISEAKSHAADLVVSASAQAEQERAEAEQIVARARSEADEIVAQARATGADTLTRVRAKAADHLKRTHDEIAALQKEAEARIRELDTDTKAVWNERDVLLDEIHGLATRLQKVAREAGTRVSREVATDSPEPESGSPTEADAVPAEAPTEIVEPQAPPRKQSKART
jgi:DivIVA domain-containing protein